MREADDFVRGLGPYSRLNASSPAKPCSRNPPAVINSSPGAGRRAAVRKGIYDAALDAASWPKALRLVAEAAGCSASELCGSMTTLGASYFLTAKVLDGRQISANLAAQGALERSAATPHQLTVLKRLTPHLRRALQIGQQVGHMNQHLKVFHEVVDRLPIGVIIR